MPWREVLDDLHTSVIQSIDRLRVTLEELERHEETTRSELEFLRSIDKELVDYFFDFSKVMDLIVAGACSLTQADSAQLLVPENGGHLRIDWSTSKDLIGKRLPIRESITGKALLKAHPVPVPDVRACAAYFQLRRETRSELAVPMVDKEGGVLAVVNLESDKKGHFTDHHKELVLTLAGQAAIGFRNARLYRELISLLDTFSSIQEEKRLRPLLTKVGEHTLELVKAEHCQVLAVYEDELVVEYTTGEEIPGVARVKTDNSVSGRALRTGKPIRFDNVQTDPAAKGLYQGVLGRMKSELAVPIIWYQEKLGVINVESAKARAFTPHDEHLLQLFAFLAAIAIKNARSMQDALWKNRVESELWALAQIGDAYGPLVHRLNTDAGMISANFNELWYKYGDLLAANDDLKEILEDIEASAQRLAQLPSKLKQELQMVYSYEEIDILALLQEVIDDFGVQPGIEFLTDFESHKKIHCTLQLRSALENLIRNSVEALEEMGGKIVITTRDWVTRPRVGGATFSGVEIRVSDTCGGIPDDQDIWGAGTTDKVTSGHYGFGLWWVRSFLDRVGGTVDVQSSAEVLGSVGCEFTIRLPTRCRPPQLPETLEVAESSQTLPSEVPQ